MGSVLSALAIVSSAPVMVPELAGAAAAETADLREAALSAAAGLPSRWIGVGVGDRDTTVPPDTSGTFAGYGRDVPVGLSAEAAGRPPTAQPLCVLVTAWLRGLAQPQACAEVRTYRPDHTARAALDLGRTLRAEIEAHNDPIGVLVVADGANTLSPTAPGGYDPDSLPVQAALDDALAAGDSAALAALPDTIPGRVAYQVLAGLTDPAPRSAKELYRGAPYGVGYFVGVWMP